MTTKAKPKKRPPPARHTVASTKLLQIMREDGSIAAKLRELFDKSQLSRLVRGERSVDLENAVEVRKITKGRIVEDDWLKEVPAPQPCESCGR